MNHIAPPLLFSNRTDVGKIREKNEDYLGYFRNDRCHVFVVADGMGGEAGGQVASRTAVEQVRASFDADAGAAPHIFLERALKAANEACLRMQVKDPALKGMGTTLDILVVKDYQAWCGHVGDSRVYLIRDGSAQPVTNDHTRVQQMVDDGLLTCEEAAEHPHRNILSRVIGRDENLEPDVSSSPIELRDGDALLMCSDGLHDVVTPAEMAWNVLRCGPDQACERLVELANQRGGHDNTTVQVIFKGRAQAAWKRSKSVPLVPPPDHRRSRKKLAVATFTILAIVATLAAWLWVRNISRRERIASLDLSKLCAAAAADETASYTFAGLDWKLSPPEICPGSPGTPLKYSGEDLSPPEGSRYRTVFTWAQPAQVSASSAEHSIEFLVRWKPGKVQAPVSNAQLVLTRGGTQISESFTLPLVPASSGGGCALIPGNLHRLTVIAAIHRYSVVLDGKSCHTVDDRIPDVSPPATLALSSAISGDAINPIDGWALEFEKVQVFDKVRAGENK